MATIESLLEIMQRLRDPAGGCPWDLEQDFASISPHTIEEAYEVDEAIASGDLESLRDELGDLLFQVVFQARIAEEMGAFHFESVVEAITSKLIRRHPHIFAGEATPDSIGDQLENWEAIKAVERTSADLSRGGAPDPFAGIPRKLPALARSAKILGRLARIEMEGASSDRDVKATKILARLNASTLSGQRALEQEAGSASARPEALRVVGEGLRAWVELARELGVDPEQALRNLDDEVIAAIREGMSQG